MDRRAFLQGLFGAAVVAGLPPALEAMPEQKFREIAGRCRVEMGDGICLTPSGDYGYATLKFLNSPPWLAWNVPEGWKPLREESNRIEAEQIARIKKEFGHG